MGSRGCCDQSTENSSQGVAEKTLGRNPPPGRCRRREGRRIQARSGACHWLGPRPSRCSGGPLRSGAAAGGCSGGHSDSALT